MAKILSKERVARYSTEFKVRVVKLTLELNVDATKIAAIMGLHPVMVYRWRQEYREGLLVEIPTRRISMTKNKATHTKQNQKEIKQLKKQLNKLQKENDFLKKWEQYLKNQNQHDSNS